MNIDHPAPAENPNPDQRTIATITMAASKVAGMVALDRDQREDAGPRFPASALADRVGFTALGSGHRVRAAASDDQEVHQ